MSFELPEILLNDFATSVIDNSEKVERTVYGKVVPNPDGDDILVQLDGSNVTTPATALVGVNVDDRVAVMFKNRHCVITGNLSSPAITTSGSFSYSDLPDKPSIETVTLIGDKSFEDLGLDRITNTELEEMLTL